MKHMVKIITLSGTTFDAEYPSEEEALKSYESILKGIADKKQIIDFNFPGNRNKTSIFTQYIVAIDYKAR